VVVYYVVKGRAIRFAWATRTERCSGSVELAPPGVPHRFHSITEELRILVFFAPA